MRTVTRAFLRYLPRRRGLSILQLLGISCGVAAAMGMSLSARSALTSFAEAVEFLKGRATHSLQRPAGPMDERLVARIMRDRAVEAFSPVIDRRIRLGNGEVARFLGVDPFLEREIRPQLWKYRTGKAHRGGTRGILSFLLEERSVLVDAELAERLDLGPGDLLATSHGDLRVLDTFPTSSGEPLILMDIAHAQALLGLSGQIDRVDLILRDSEAFSTRWEKGFVIQSSGQRRATLSEMLSAFRLNLEALSMLALFVGVFLVYNTAMFAVVSRRRDAGILRSLGAKRGEVVSAFLSEILLLGAIGGALGAILGYFLSRFLTLVVGGTISNLYFFLRPTLPTWSWWISAIGVLLGCGASLLGGLFPLAELVRIDPVQALWGRIASRRSGTHRVLKVALAGIGVLGVSIALVLAASLNVYLGFAGAFTFLLGASFLTGQALLAMGPALRWGLHRLGGLPGKVAAGNIRQNLGRTGVAVAAFMIALSMSIGLGSMIGSFRETLIWWMNGQLGGELYVVPSEEIRVPEALYHELRSLPGVDGVDPHRRVQILYMGTPVHVRTGDASVLQKHARFGWLRGGDENWEAVKRGAVIVSESFARRFAAKAGDTLTLEGIDGPTSRKIAAVFYDYTTEHGLIFMDRSTYLEIYGDHSLDGLGIFVDAEGPQRETILEQARRRIDAWGLPAATREQMQQNILDVFDATFAVTRSMRLLAVIVAFFGIAGALLTLFMERQREFGIYRALGFSTSQVAGMTLMEGLGMGLASLVLSIGVGTVLTILLIRVINLHSFNWTIFFHPEWRPYLLAAATALLASLGAAAYPIWRVRLTYPQMQIREE